MEWLWDRVQRSTRALALHIVRAGSVPHHVGLVMDGNRRWAERQHLERSAGHRHGFDALLRVLEFLLECGVGVVTVYAFSIENFKRTKEEVGELMALAREKLHELAKQRNFVQRNNVRVRVCGDVTLLPRDVQETLARTVAETEKNTGPVLNVCLGYTSRDEIARAGLRIAESIGRGDLEGRDVNEELLAQCLDTEEFARVDVLVRTSGVSRLSDFLLWQSAFAQVSILDVLWPDVGPWHLFWCFMRYQAHAADIQTRRAAYLERLEDEDWNACCAAALGNVVDRDSITAEQRETVENELAAMKLRRSRHVSRERRQRRDSIRALL